MNSFPWFTLLYAGISFLYCDSASRCWFGPSLMLCSAAVNLRWLPIIQRVHHVQIRLVRTGFFRSDEKYNDDKRNPVIVGNISWWILLPSVSCHEPCYALHRHWGNYSVAEITITITTVFQYHFIDPQSVLFADHVDSEWRWEHTGVWLRIEEFPHSHHKWNRSNYYPLSLSFSTRHHCTTIVFVDALV